MTIGEKISTARRRIKMSQETLASRVGVSSMTIIRIEGGQSSPRLEHLKLLAIALEMDLSDLVL